MSIFDKFLPATIKKERKATQELGRGIWRQTFDRFMRAIDRYHQILEGIPSTSANLAVRDALVEVGNKAADHIDQVAALCMFGQEQAPTDEPHLTRASDGQIRDIPRYLSKAATYIAQAAEAAAMARVQLAAHNDMLAHLRTEAAARSVELAIEHIQAAESVKPEA